MPKCCGRGKRAETIVKQMILLPNRALKLMYLTSNLFLKEDVWARERELVTKDCRKSHSEEHDHL
jgi:hypothetical protein